MAEHRGVTAAGPSISVVIPAYQAEAYLAESIESVLAQERPAQEVIVVDDGSSDGTGDVARGFGDAVTLLRHADNRGEAASRNTGLAAASGELIAMHDADDLMRPHRLRVQLEHLEAGGPELGCVVARTRPFTEAGGPLPAWVANTDAEPYGSALVLAWRATYDRVGGYDESFVTGTDSDWLIRVKTAGLTVGQVDEVLTERRIHDTSLTAQVAGDRRAYATALRKVLAARRAAT